MNLRRYLNAVLFSFVAGGSEIADLTVYIDRPSSLSLSLGCFHQITKKLLMAVQVILLF